MREFGERQSMQDHDKSREQKNIRDYKDWELAFASDHPAIIAERKRRSMEQPLIEWRIYSDTHKTIRNVYWDADKVELVTNAEFYIIQTICEKLNIKMVQR